MIFILVQLIFSLKATVILLRRFETSLTGVCTQSRELPWTPRVKSSTDVSPERWSYCLDSTMKM